MAPGTPWSRVVPCGRGWRSDAQGREVASASGCITDLTGVWTADRVEFIALVQALRWAHDEAPGRPVECRSDSTHAVCALYTPYCDDVLQDLRNQTRALVQATGAKIVCVPRKAVRLADWLCRRTWKAYIPKGWTDVRWR